MREGEQIVRGDVDSMTQWNSAKSQYPDVLLMLRSGDFYELFGNDARLVARECELTLTVRGNGESAVPMCGVPYNSVERYITLLNSRGYRCAIFDHPSEAHNECPKCGGSGLCDCCDGIGRIEPQEANHAE